MVVRMNKGDAIVRERPRLVPSSPSYTLAEIQQLAREYTASRRDDHSLIRELTMSLFVEWLAKREQWKGEGDGNEK